MKFAAVDLHVTFVINREEIRVHNASVDGHGPTDTVVQRRSSNITVGLEGTAVDYHGAGVAPVSYTHLDVYKRQGFPLHGRPLLPQKGKLS